MAGSGVREVLVLRPYQQKAVNAVWGHISRKLSSPCVVIPTGGGKTPIIASLCKQAVEEWNGRVCVLAHVKELLEQASRKLSDVGLDHAVYSAGLKRRESDSSVVIAGIQSVYRRAFELGRFDLIFIDEAHLIPSDGEGMYRTFLKDAREVNPNVRLVGFTATPYRLGSGELCHADGLLNEVCYEAGVRELISQGYLSRLRGKRGLEIDTSSLDVRNGEFVPAQAEGLMRDVVSAAVDEILKLGSQRRSILLFCSGILHGQEVQAELLSRGETCGFICSETEDAERKRQIESFRAGHIRFLSNVNVLTTGFDAPNVDCVCLLRPTMSPGLYYQMVGRGLRLSPGKTDCLVLDFGENIERHGPIDELRVRGKRKTGENGERAKVCPSCKELISVGYRVCPECEYEFPPNQKATHQETATSAAVTTLEIKNETHQVMDVLYAVHTKKDSEPGHPRTLRVEYFYTLAERVSEWICVEHEGFAKQKAYRWWSQRCLLPMPSDADEALQIARNGLLAFPQSVTIRRTPGKRYPELISVGVSSPPAVVTGEVCDMVFEWIGDQPCVSVREVTEAFPSLSSVVAEGVLNAIQAQHGGVWDYRTAGEEYADERVLVLPITEGEVPF